MITGQVVVTTGQVVGEAPSTLKYLSESSDKPVRSIVLPTFAGAEGFPGKESTCIAGDWGSIPGLGRFPREGNGNPTPVFLPREFHGQRSLAGYSPWDHKESA